MQAAAQAALGWGALVPSRWVAGFLIGNAIGVSSIFVLMQLYGGGNAGLAFALDGGGAFVAAQIALAMVTRQSPALGQWACIALIVAGMVGYVFLARSTNSTTVAVAIGADRNTEAK
jgi:multidrug transporter EmrE-like cation transporter